METKDDLFEKAIFNNTLNLIVPMLSMALPSHSDNGDPLDIMYQVVLVGFGILAAITYIGVPSSLAIADDSINSKSRRLRSATSWKFNTSNAFDKIGLHWDECLRKTICEAHQRRDEFGAFALPLQIFFPSPPTDHLSQNESETPTCLDRYNCFFDVLDLGKYFYEWWRKGKSTTTT